MPIVLAALLLGPFCSACADGSGVGIRVVERAPAPGREGLAHDVLFLLTSQAGAPTVDEAATWAEDLGWKVLDAPISGTFDVRPSWAEIEAVKRNDETIDLLWIGRTERVLAAPAADFSADVRERLRAGGFDQDDVLVGEEVRLPLLELVDADHD